MPKEPPRSAVKPSPPSGKGLKRAAPPAAAKAAPKKKKPVAKPSEGEAKFAPSQSQAKKKILKPKVVLTKLKLNPGAESQPAKTKVKDTKKETNPKPVKPKPKKVVVSKATKKVIKLENESKRATAAKIVRAVKDVKKARSVVASKMAKTSPKKLSDSASRKASQDEINVVKKHNIVKRVNKMSGKKPCVVSVKIRNAHSTVTLSVKQNKQVKKDPTKCSKSSGSKNNDRSTISIVKKGIASRRKSTSKECTSQESTPSQSPTRDTSPVRSKEGKPTAKTKKAEHVKSQKKLVKQGSLENKKGVEDKGKDKQSESQDIIDPSGKTELIINENVKIKTENIGDDQNMEIEFTNDSEKDPVIEKAGNKEVVDKDGRNKSDCLSVLELKVKSPLSDYGNIKSIDSTTSDEVPLEVLKMKQKNIKKEKDSELPSKELHMTEKTKKGKEQPKSESKEHSSLSSKEDVGSSPNTDKKKADSSKQSKPMKSKCISKKELKKLDQETKLKISTKGKEKHKDIALKQKVAKLVKKSKLAAEQKNKKGQDKEEDEKDTDSSDQGRRRLKLLKFWNGPKRHRVASLNALAKVHCLYENESRSALNDVISSAAILQRVIQESKETAKQANKKAENKEKKPVVKKPAARDRKSPEPASTRTLRTNPGVRSVGRNFDILNVISSTSLSSSSSEESSDSGEEKKQLALLPSVKQKQEMIKKEEAEQTTDDEVPRKSSPVSEESKDAAKKVKKRRRKRNELTMDLKDMVVRKRMASLNASAIMTASYSTEKKIDRRREEEVKKERKKRKKQLSSPEAEESSADEDVIVRTTNNKQKVAVIVNQDTDVTITGVYVNSTTRSTHHEGYCSIAGMQYRISSTSHTQTEATAVSTETVLHSDHPPCLPVEAVPPVPTTTLASPCKSYTPLSALSSMQPPGHPHAHAHAHPPPLSPLQRRHGCSSAFSAPHNYPPPPPPPPPPHADVHGNYQWKVDMPCCPGQPSRLCYYQPAGPLISTHHHHHHSSSASVSGGKLPAPAPAPSPPRPQPPTATSETEVVLPSSDNPQPQPQPSQPRYPPQPYSYPGYQYYPSPPASSLQYPAQQGHYHQEVCYSAPSGYPPGYFPKGHYPPGYPPRRYGHQYYPPQEFYPSPPAANPSAAAQGQQMMVPAAPPAGAQGSSYPPPAEGGYPPPAPAPMVDPYPPPPPPQGYYPGYSAGPPPCYSTHSPASRGLFIDPAYQACPCPMQSCPKNVHTGPLTGASKGSLKNHQATPLPPVALALPLEPPGALGPPSPARGSAGMPPPPSPALATARQSPPPPPGLLTISRMVTDAVMLSEQLDTIPDLVPKTEPIKLEVEDIVKVEVTEEVKCNRKRRKSLKSPTDFKRQAFEPQTNLEIQPELQERLITPKEEPDKSPTLHVDKTILPEVEKQLPLSDNGATVPVKNNCIVPVLNGNVPKETKKRKTTISECEPATKVAKCVKTPKIVKKKCVNRNKRAEENIAPEVVSAEPAKVVCRRSSKPVERRKSSCSPATVREAVNQESSTEESSEAGKKKKIVRGKKVQEKTKADHLLRSHSKTELQPASVKERRLSKAGSTKSEVSPVRVSKKPLVGQPAPALGPAVDPSAESSVSLPGLRRPVLPKWSNGWTWEGSPFKAKIFLNNDDGAVVRTCYPAMRHAQGDSISARDCVLLKSGLRRTDLPYVAKVVAMWENPDDGEMMVSLLWYYRPEHTEQGRRSEDIPDEIFASRHKDTNSVACIEDKCFVLTFNEYCRYRKSVRQLEEGVSGGGLMVPPPEYPRSSRQPPGRVSPDLVFFCRRVYDFRQKRILKNPC